MSAHKSLLQFGDPISVNEARPVRLEDSLSKVGHFQTLAHLGMKSLLGSWGAI
jgi:hypothetical protein